jgi:hypothetical protein
LKSKWCQFKSITLLRQRLARPNQPPWSLGGNGRAVVSAYVYLLHEEPISGDASGPWTKIGFSKNPPEWRLNANLKRGNPRNVVVAAAFEYETSEAALLAEKNARSHFSARKHQKEWFRITWQEASAWFESLGHIKRVVDAQPTVQADGPASGGG